MLKLIFAIDFLESSVAIRNNEDTINDSNYRWTGFLNLKSRISLTGSKPFKVEVDNLFDAETDTKFLLFTRNNPNVSQHINFDLEILRNTNFNKNHPTRFTIHGWNCATNSDVNTRSIEEYLKKGFFNVVVVDWSRGASTINYMEARNRVSDVGRVTAKFIDFLYEHDYIQFENLYAIGYDLGAHIAGITGKHIKGGKIQAIIALDPAGPLFNIEKPDQRLSQTDGVYVEVIHTNALTLGFGDQIGHADFFVNFGKRQPGCGFDFTGSCAHNRAPLLFAESISSNIGFRAVGCESFLEMNVSRVCTPSGVVAKMGGEPANIGLTGLFYVSTNAYSPFAKE